MKKDTETKSALAGISSIALFGIWYPIETAPKDGTEILAWRDDCGILLARWDAPENFLPDSECEKLGSESAEQYDWFYADFVDGGRLEGSEIPTHWMPLPSFPNVSRQGHPTGREGA